MSLDAGPANAKNEKPLHGRIDMMSGKGRLRSVAMDLPTDEIAIFKKHCFALLAYGKAISNELGLGDETFEEMLGMPPPSLEMPQWPDSPKKRLHYIQD